MKHENELNQQAMIRAVSQKSGVSQAVVRTVLRAFFDVIAETLRARGRVKITNFGTFSTRTMVTHNPHTRETLPAKTFATWSPRGRIRQVVAKEVPYTTLTKRPSH